MDSHTDPVVMTVLGPVSPGQLCVPALCREWLLNDQSVLRTCDGVGDAGDQVTLETVAIARRWPLRFLHNLHLSYDDILAELNSLPQGSVVVDCTPRAYWAQTDPGQRSALLWSLASESGARLVMGTVPSLETHSAGGDVDLVKAAAEQMMHELREGHELRVVPGYSDRLRLPQSGSPQNVRAGFVGELALSSSEVAETLELLALRAGVEVQVRTGAPMIVSGPVSRKAFAILDGSCLWGRCVFFDVPHDSPISSTLLAERGGLLGYSPPSAGANIAWQLFPHQKPWNSEADFLSAVSRGAVDGQVLTGSGLRFRTDLQAFGGFGLAHTPSLLASIANQDDLQAMLRNASVQFLQYSWKPLAAEAAKPPPGPDTIVCQWCGTLRSDGKHFSKMGFDYCTPKCIREHKQVDFAPDRHAVGASGSL